MTNADRRGRTAPIALLLLGLTLAMVAFASAGALWLPQVEGLPSGVDGLADALSIVAVLFPALSLPIIGTVLAIRRPGNAVGWILLLSGACLMFGFFAPEYVKRSVQLGWELPLYRLVDWLYPPVQAFGFVLLFLWLPLVFPEGLLPGRRWRRIAMAAGAACAAAAVWQLFLHDDPEHGRTLPNPTGLDGAAGTAVQLLADLTNIVLIAFIAIAFLSVILRFRRSRGVERQQLKWFLAATSLTFVAMLVLSTSVSDTAFFAALIALGFLPIAIGIAVLRYRLYEIDRLISRTIGWALVTGLLVGTFALLVLGSSAVLEPLTGGNTLAVAGSTLIVALLFTPVRSRVQGIVDRRFDRSRYDGERTLEAFGERLRDEVDLPTIRADVLATVGTSVRPTRVGLWLRTPGGEG